MLKDEFLRNDMDKQKMIDILGQTSLFELYRFRVLLHKMLEDPKRLDEVKAKLKLNQKIIYLDGGTNQEIIATITKIGRTNVSVTNIHDGKKWLIPLYMINDTGLVSNTLPSTGKVNRITLRIGERVGFITKEGQSVYGTVSKLNQKTASVIVSSGGTWRVSYQYLFYVIDGTIGFQIKIAA